MGKTPEATDTQKTLLTVLYEGWCLRFTDVHGWCLFQPGRQRPFGRVKTRTVERMTRAGWLSEGMTTQGLGFFPRKDLTNAGIRYARKLAAEEWAETYDWDPYDSTHHRDFGNPEVTRKAA